MTRKEEQTASTGPQGALALVGAWGEVPDELVDAIIADVYVQRTQDEGRRVDLGD